ncbi:menaquinone-dependent protoporphyrinogen IX dehydrogenase [Zunongwangia sp.]|uniref:menaquinone-dependent protoporphyrinogen IX dehydrogenase n=1 Tax=Zunongwangia sp. TaxID=1965325 RepID=UPI003AA9C123
MKKIGILYSSVDGHTKEICTVLSKKLAKSDKKITLIPISKFNKNITDFEVIVIGASIRYGKHRKEVFKFIEQHKAKFPKLKTAFFSVNLVARNSNKNSPETNPYLLKFLKKIDWKPDLLEVFAGKLDYKAYSFLDRIMIQLIMKLTHGPTSSKEAIDYTNWEKVARFSEKIMQLTSPPSK